MASGKDVLFLSDSLFDIDIGIIRYLRKNFNNSKFFNNNILNRSELFFISYIVEECKNNILDIVLKDKYKNSSIDLYNEILYSNYKEIINESPMTSLMDSVLAFKQSEIYSSIIPVVACRHKCEMDILSKINNNIAMEYTPTDNDIFNLNLERYTRIILRNIKDINKFDKEKKVLGKSIVVLSYRYNFELNNDKKLLEQYTDISDINTFEVAIPYSGYCSPA